MKTKAVLIAFLVVMALLIVAGVVWYEPIVAALFQPDLYAHALFVHVVAVTLFFANAVIGMVWELRSLASGQKEVILHTYRTVAWLDARFSSPLILVSVFTGLLLGFTIGNLWMIGWLSASFLLFMLSGIVWVVSDIPSQYRVKALMAALEPSDPALPPELVGLLRRRTWISLAGIVPLVVVFALMIYQPEMPAIGELFGAP